MKVTPPVEVCGFETTVYVPVAGNVMLFTEPPPQKLLLVRVVPSGFTIATHSAQQAYVSLLITRLIVCPDVPLNVRSKPWPASVLLMLVAVLNGNDCVMFWVSMKVTPPVEVCGFAT